MEQGIGKGRRTRKHLPRRMMRAFAESIEDPNGLSLRNEVALVDARLVDVLGRVDTGESGEIWQGLKKDWEELEAARGAGENEKAAGILGRIGVAISRGQSDWAAWRDVRQLLQERKILVESERKRLVELNQMMTIEQALLLGGALLAAIKRHVTDTRTLDAISVEFDRLYAGPHGGTDPQRTEPRLVVDRRDGGTPQV